MPAVHTKIGKALSAAALTLFALCLGSPSWSGEIVLKVEEPERGGIMTGVSNIRGWAVGSAGIDRIELYIDGDYRTDIPFGGSRKDVGSAYPNYPDSDTSGFSMANNYSLKSAGSHVITIKAYDNDGAATEIDIPYHVTRFEDSFIKDPADIDISTMSDLLISGSRSITMRGVDVQGDKQDIRLDWQTPKQNFSITSVLPADEGSGSALDGVYRLTRMTLWFGFVPDLPPGLILDTEAESTEAGGVSFSMTASGTMKVQGSVIRTNLTFTLTGGGISETLQEQYDDSIVNDAGYAITYRDSIGATWDALLLQRGTHLVWMEHEYGAPEAGDGVLVLQWQKSVTVSATEATNLDSGAAGFYDTAHSSITDAVLQSARNILQAAGQ